MMDGKSVDFIVKLGGSAITDKAVCESPKQEEIKKAAELVAQARRNSRTCIVVHGAGSFGHQHAHDYNVNRGWRHLSSDEQSRVKKGFSITRQAVTKLNHLVVEEFTAAGVSAVTLSPCGIWKTESGRVIRSDVESVWELLACGLVPVLHGDCVLDSEQGCAILSGDTIIQVLSATFRPSMVIFLSDVLGIYDRPPDLPGAALLPEVVCQSDGSIDIPVLTSAHKHDVTGGVQLKLLAAIEVVCASKGRTKVLICHILSVAARNVLLYGDSRGEPCTLLRLQSAE